MTERSPSSYYFPPGRSIARQVHEERAVGALYGSRALLIGALEPLAYTGTMLSTRSITRPFLRLARTAKMQEAVLLGTREEADRALALVHRLHQSAEGTLPFSAGRYRAGTRYSALDPQLMLWTLAVIADSARVVFETLIRPLSEAERESLWQDYILFGRLFGVPADVIPASHRELSAWLAERLDSPDLHATQHAAEVAPALAFDHPVPALARPLLHLNNLVIKGTLPERVREIFGIPWTPAQATTFRAFAATYRHTGRHLVPQKVRRGRTERFLDSVIEIERKRGGTPTPPLVGAQ